MSDAMRKCADAVSKLAARFDSFVARRRDDDAIKGNWTKGLKTKSQLEQSEKGKNKETKSGPGQNHDPRTGRFDLDGYMEGGKFHPIRNSEGYKGYRASSGKKR